MAENVDIPIVLYNVPGRTGTKMLPETIAELYKVPNIVAVKEACDSVDQVSDILQLCDITVLSGADALNLPILAVGGEGAISVVANVVPAKMVALHEAFDAGNLERARELHYELLPLCRGLFLESNPMPVKAALAGMGLIENVLRLPLTSMRPEKYAELEPILKQVGAID